MCHHDVDNFPSSISSILYTPSLEIKHIENHILPARFRFYLLHRSHVRGSDFRKDTPALVTVTAGAARGM